MNYEFNLIYGGFITYFKKDKNGNKTEEEYTMYKLFEKDDDKHVVNEVVFNVKGANPFRYNGNLLEPVKAVIKVSATSNYKELINLKK